jgi:uncharacterized protein
MKLSFYHVATRALVDETTASSIRVLFSTRTGQACVVDDASWRLVETHRADQLSTNALSLLSDMKILIDDQEEQQDELQQVIAENDAAAGSGDDYYLVIQPTALCQLGCDYCGQHHTPNSMGEADRAALVERSEREVRAGHFKTFSVCWFGGEPLLAMPVIRDLSRRLLAVAAAAGCPYQAKIVTNGLSLNAAVARELIEDLGVTEIEITLDGDAEAHDVRRSKKVSGAPTFRRIFANLCQLVELAPPHVDINLRCNVDHRNAESSFLLAERLADAGLQTRVSFYLASVYSWGNDAHKLSLSREDFADLELRFLTRLGQLGFKLHLLPRRKRVVCLAVTPSGKVVDAFGQVYNCTEVSYVPAYGVPNTYAEGAIAAPAHSDKAAALRRFNEDILAGRLPCHTCRMLPVCGGSCPKKWLEGHVPCPSNKINIEGKLLLTLAHERIRRLPIAGELQDGQAQDIEPALAC